MLRALLRDVEARNGSVPEAAWHAAIAARVGVTQERADHEDVLLTGKRASPPPDALGGCFEVRQSSYPVFEPGFALAASNDARRVTSLAPRGPAARAGLREGDVLIRTSERLTNGAVMMRVDVERGEKTEAVEYRVSDRTLRGPAFHRRAGLSDAACRKLALRR